MQQWPFEDPSMHGYLRYNDSFRCIILYVVADLFLFFLPFVRLTLSKIVDVAHNHNKEFMKRVMSVPRYNELAAKKFDIWTLSEKSLEIMDELTKAMIV